jgi:hypothetical protein
MQCNGRALDTEINKLKQLDTVVRGLSIGTRVL